MEVIVIESEAYKNLMFKIDTLFKALTKPVKEEDKWLTMEEVMEYTGFKYSWIMTRRSRIGYFRDGNGLRFKKANIDKYMEANSFKIK